MKKSLFLRLIVTLGALMLVGCSPAEESAPIGSMVRPLDIGGEPIEMHESPHPAGAVIASLTPENECEVVGGPRSAEGVTFWKLTCQHGINPFTETYSHIDGWVDAAQLEVLD